MLLAKFMETYSSTNLEHTTQTIASSQVTTMNWYKKQLLNFYEAEVANLAQREHSFPVVLLAKYLTAAKQYRPTKISWLFWQILSIKLFAAYQKNYVSSIRIKHNLDVIIIWYSNDEFLITVHKNYGYT